MLPLVLDRNAEAPLASQIASGIRSLVASGVLLAGEAVPSSRALAAHLGVSRGTAVAAYDQLISEGYLVSRPGATTRIHSDAGRLSTRGAEIAPAIHRPGGRSTPAVDEPLTALAPEPDVLIDLSPHHRSMTSLDDPAWREAWRRAATASSRSGSAAAAPVGGPGAYPRLSAPAAVPPQGLTELRQAIAEHLRLMRSMPVDPDDILITSGARDGLALVLLTLREALAPVAVESPGYPGPLRVLTRLGMPILPAAVDADGIVASRLPSAARSVLVTPNHLYPVGSSMPASRRIELLQHAVDRQLLVIEDDFDSDYRHVGAPLPTLWDLAQEHVIHLGTFTQVLTREAAVGYVLAPRAAHGALIAARTDLGSGPSAIAQRALAAFLASGGLRRHITRRRRELLRRRRLLLDTLAAWPVQMVSGAHAVIRLDSSAQARQIVDACAQEGVAIGDLDTYWGAADGTADATHGIVLHCGDTSTAELSTALRVLSAALERATRR